MSRVMILEQKVYEQLLERAVRCSELEKLAVEVVASLRLLAQDSGNGVDVGPYLAGAERAYSLAAALVAEKLGVKS